MHATAEHQPGGNSMKAVTLDAAGATPALREDLPAPDPGEVLVRVHATSVNPIDRAIAAGMLAELGIAEHVYPITLGRDLAGIVEATGAGVGTVAVGDEVFGMIRGWEPTVHNGTWAELVAVPASNLARKPAAVDFATAGAAPLAAITAISCLDAMHISSGDTVLIVGASGGIGGLAVQLAAATGATVIAPGLPEDEAYLRELGASEVPMRDDNPAAAVREIAPNGVDAILDAVSYAPGTYDNLLAPGGRLASTNNAAGDGPGRTNAMSDPHLIGQVARHLTDGSLKVHVQRSWELAEAPEALQALTDEHTQGKLAIRVR
jgi:NADPH:quinone reductase-like Zn-dependent oxidoreductase